MLDELLKKIELKKEKNKIIVISGSTASGKTGLSINIAKKINASIINADSMQIYKGLPMLSAQPTIEEQSGIEHLLFSHLDADDNCDVGKWLKLVKEKIDYCFLNNKIPIVVGGTGMYISKLIGGLSQIPEISKDIREEVEDIYNKSDKEDFYNIVKEIDVEYVKNININDKQRLMRVLEVYKGTGKSIKHFIEKENVKLYNEDKFFHINIQLDRELLYKRCNLRFIDMIENQNVLSEIEDFANNNKKIIDDYSSYSISKTIGLREGIEFLKNNISKEEFIELSTRNTRRYAKRQTTWFRTQFDSFDFIYK